MPAFRLTHKRSHGLRCSRTRAAYPGSMRVAAPTLELLEWATARSRTYDDVREAWRSNCPRTAVWDDAVTDGLVRIDRRTDAGSGAVILTARGLEALNASRSGTR